MFLGLQCFLSSSIYICRLCKEIITHDSMVSVQEPLLDFLRPLGPAIQSGLKATQCNICDF